MILKSAGVGWHKRNAGLVFAAMAFHSQTAVIACSNSKLLEQLSFADP